jgi:hypothetical protein
VQVGAFCLCGGHDEHVTVSGVSLLKKGNQKELGANEGRFKFFMNTFSISVVNATFEETLNCCYTSSFFLFFAHMKNK